MMSVHEERYEREFIKAWPLIKARIKAVRDWRANNNWQTFPMDIDLDKLVPDRKGVLKGKPTDREMVQMMTMKYVDAIAYNRQRRAENAISRTK